MIFKQSVLSEINLDSNTMFIKVTFALLLLINQSKSWDLDFKNCKKQHTYNTVCAVLYSSKYCHYNQWNYPFIILSKGGQKVVIPSHKRKSGFQSLVVKKGCGLKVYDNKRCEGFGHIFGATKENDLVIENLSDHINARFNGNIECVKCLCS